MTGLVETGLVEESVMALPARRASDRREGWASNCVQPRNCGYSRCSAVPGPRAVRGSRKVEARTVRVLGGPTHPLSSPAGRAAAREGDPEPPPGFWIPFPRLRGVYP